MTKGRERAEKWKLTRREQAENGRSTGGERAKQKKRAENGQNTFRKRAK